MRGRGVCEGCCYCGTEGAGAGAGAWEGGGGVRGDECLACVGAECGWVEEGF